MDSERSSQNRAMGTTYYEPALPRLNLIDYQKGPGEYWYFPWPFVDARLFLPRIPHP